MSVAACQSGDNAGSVLAVGSGTTSAADAEGMVRESELRAYCPKIVLREGTAIHNVYDKKADQDPTKLVYRGSITDVTRSCSYAPGSITVNVALAGKVIPGPMAQNGTVTMPIRVVAIRGEEVLYSQLHNVPVSIDRNAGASQFVFTDPAVTVPAYADGTMQLFAGYDEGPVKKKPDDE